MKTHPYTIIEYIKTSIEILIDLKVQEKCAEQLQQDSQLHSEEPNNYEKLLWKLESDIRNFIKVHKQLTTDRTSNEIIC